VARVLRGFQLRTVFPTRIMVGNILPQLPKGFAERLSELAINEYEEFGKKYVDMDPNDLNDKFFGAQATNAEDMSPKQQRIWPEMYQNSEDFKILTRVMKGALKGFLARSGVSQTAVDDEDYRLVLWAAVYPGNGGRHGYHVHQGSISSCVLYTRTAGASTPITFVDPRGAPPVDDYEQFEQERDFEPVAPFHHSEHFFPDAGDLVCFPSWLVHNVPSHFEKTHRVAFAANLQGSSAWDSWHRTAVTWS
ncbi:unnamed protein product, partial [Polarella glacialis]